MFVTKKGTFCVKVHKWEYTFDRDTCEVCPCYNSCCKYVSQLKRPKPPKKKPRKDWVALGMPANYYSPLTDEDILTMICAYQDKRFMEDVAAEIERTPGSVGWIYATLNQLENHPESDVLEFFGADRTQRVIDLRRSA